MKIELLREESTVKIIIELHKETQDIASIRLYPYEGASFLNRKGEGEIVPNSIIKSSKKEQWKPKEGERYWFIHWDGTVQQEEWSNRSLLDVTHLSIGNYYPTKEEAQKHVEGVRRAYKEIL